MAQGHPLNTQENKTSHLAVAMGDAGKHETVTEQARFITSAPAASSRFRKLTCLQILLCFVFLFRSQCLKQYVELLIKEGLETAISCPDAACPKQGHLQEEEARTPQQTRVVTCATGPCLLGFAAVVGSLQADLPLCSRPRLVTLLVCIFFLLDRVHGGGGNYAKI